MRKYYLDNIRWITVVLVLIYHVFYFFNSSGVLGGIGGFTKIQYQDSFLYFVYPWFMVLLFLVSGMSSKFALEKKTNKEFINSRTVKLLVPSTIGLFVFQWIVGYFNIASGGAMDQLPAALRYPIIVMTGIGPLWFIQMLWLFSLLLVLIRKIDKNEKFYALCGKTNIIIVLLMFIPLWLASLVLNAPVITTYRFGIYFLAFLLGYFVFSHDEVVEKVEKLRIPLLILAVLGGVFYTWYYFGTDYTKNSNLQNIFTNLYAWVAILAILACGKAYLNKTSPFASYMAKSSFGIYIVHYAVLIPFCYCLKKYTSLPPVAIYIFALIEVFALSPLVYELLRRIPIIRYCVLGIKKAKTVKVAKTEKLAE